MLFTQDTKLSDAIFSAPSIVPVIDRLGISLGFGDLSIWEVCKNNNLPVPFFLAIINTFVHEDYMPEDMTETFSMPALLDYLLKTNEYYSHIQLPNIERHFQLLLQRSGSDNNLNQLYIFFCEVRDELEECNRLDAEHYFPLIRQKAEDTLYTEETVSVEGDYMDLLPDNLGEVFTNRIAVEDKLTDLASIFIRHIKGNYDTNLAMAVISAVFALRKDISQNNRIRNRMLMPAVCRLFSINTSF